jgi:hypothetical protein
MHGNWHCDNEFIERALIGGYNMSRPYSYYHLNHSKDFMGAKGRPTDFQNFKLISKKILKGLKKYELA